MGGGGGIVFSDRTTRSSPFTHPNPRHPFCPGPNAPVALTAIRGYLLAATSAAGLFAYNTTALRFHDAGSSSSGGGGSGLPSLVFHLPSPRTGSDSDSGSDSPYHPPPPLLAVSIPRPLFGPGPGGSGKPPPSPPPILLLQGPDGRLRLWESLLPYARPRPIDLFWVRIPLMLVALGLVLFWHWQKQQHSHKAALLGGGGGAGRRGLFGGGGGGGGGGRRRWQGRYEEEGEEEDEDATMNIGLRPPGEVFGEGVEGEELRFMRAALQEVRQAREAGGAGFGGRSEMEEAEMEEVLRRERARIERWR
jgi:hypothetical protein